jgi:hypothetical protein
MPLLRPSSTSALLATAAYVFGSSMHGTCAAGEIELPTLHAGADVYVLEGPITAYDRTARTLTGAGVTLRLQPGALIDTDDAPGGDISFDALVDPAAEARRSILGGALKSSGSLQPVGGACFAFAPSTVHVELAEHVIVGPITAVDLAQRAFYVLGVPVRMSTDARFPAELLGAGAQPVSIATLSAFTGTLAEVQGYFEGPILKGTHVETDAYASHPVFDTVMITRATWSQGHEKLDVRGFTTLIPGTQSYASSVELHLAALLPGGAACAGALTGVLATSVDPLTGLAEFRFDTPDNSYPAMPASACVQSPGGGSFQRAFVAGS